MSALLLSIHLGSPGALVLAYFALFPLFLVGLGQGLAALILAAAAAVVLAGVAAGFNIALRFALAFAVPAALVVRLALLSRQPPGGATNWYPPGLVACWLTVYGAAAFVVLAIMTGGSQGGLEGIVRGNIAAALERFMADGGGGPQPTAMVEAIAAYFPALVIASWLIMVAINATLAQRLLTRLGRNLRPSPQLATFEVPGWMAIPVVIAVLLWGLTESQTLDFIGRNLALVFALPYFLMGLAVVHALSRRWSARLLLLGVFYMVLVFVFWAAFVVTALGFIEQWTGLRQRFAGPGNGQEEEQ